jgi:ADP-ribose pyrophosphatase
LKKTGTVHHVEEIYQGTHFSFVVEDVTLPNNNRSQYAVVRHPGSTVIVPMDEAGNIIMTLQYRHAVRKTMLETPAGTMDPGERPLHCAERELEEETGFKAGQMIELGRTHILPSYSDEMTYIYLARDLTPTKQKLDPDEIIELVHYPLDLAIQKVISGEIIDGLTIVSLFQAMFYLQNEK